MMRAVRWLFEDRSTGRIVVAQPPNAPILVAFGAFALRRLADPGGAAGTALGVVAGTAFAVWAADEVLRGVNPFRRALGAGALAALAVSISR